MSENGVFCSNYCYIFQKSDDNIGFWENYQSFSAENCRKSQKIVIITSTFGYKIVVCFKKGGKRIEAWKSSSLELWQRAREEEKEESDGAHEGQSDEAANI
jgi:hypothetical protein